MDSSMDEVVRLLKKFSEDKTPLFVFFFSADRAVSAKISGFVRAFTPTLISFSDDAMHSSDVRASAYVTVDRAAIVSCSYGTPMDVFPDSAQERLVMEEKWGVSSLVFGLTSGARLVIYERLDLSVGP